MHRIRTERRATVVVVIAEGELDAYAAPDLTRVFEDDGLRLGGRLVLDLDRASFLDSTALGLVVRYVRELRESGCEVRAVLPTGTARRIFEITALDTFLPLASSRNEAVAELAAGGD